MGQSAPAQRLSIAEPGVKTPNGAIIWDDSAQAWTSAKVSTTHIDSGAATSGYALTADGSGGATWSSVSGGGTATTGLTWMVNVLDNGVKGDGQLTHTGCTVAAGSNTASFSTNSGIGTLDSSWVGKKFYAKIGTAGAPQLRTITAVTGTRQITFNGGTAATAVSSGPGVIGSDDTTALQAAITTAVAQKAVVGVPARVYLVTSALNIKYVGLRIDGLGGRAHINNAGLYSAGGAIFLWVSESAGTIMDGEWVTNCDNGPELRNLGFHEPMLSRTDVDFLKIQSKRSRVERCSFFYGGNQCTYFSGDLDVSWGQHIDCTHKYPFTRGLWVMNGIHINPDLTIPEVPPLEGSGPSAFEVKGGDWNIGKNGATGVIGIDWAGGLYGRISGMKFDHDGDNTVCIRFSGDGDPYNYGGTTTTSTTISSLPASSITVGDTTGFPSAGQIIVAGNSGNQTITYTSKDSTHFLGCTGGSGSVTSGSTVSVNLFSATNGARLVSVYGIVVEHTSNTMTADTSYTFEVKGPAGQITFGNCQLGGGGTGSGPHGYGFYIHGTSQNPASDVQIRGCHIQNYAANIRYGAYAKNARAEGCSFGGSGKYIQWDANSSVCGFTTAYFDSTGDPIADATRLDYASATSPLLGSRSWQSGFTGYGDTSYESAFKAPVRVATTANLTVTYHTGGSTNDVGTMTNAGSQAALAIDSVTLAVGDRVLVKSQSGQTYRHGIYIVTDVGSASTNWVMTRATDADSAAEFKKGASIVVQDGTTNALTVWRQNSANVATLNTDVITYQAA